MEPRFRPESLLCPSRPHVLIVILKGDLMTVPVCELQLSSKQKEEFRVAREAEAGTEAKSHGLFSGKSPGEPRPALPEHLSFLGPRGRRRRLEALPPS